MMTRLLLLALAGVVLYLLLSRVVGAFVAGLRGPARASGGRLTRDRLVKDPVCETYVPERTAIARTAGGGDTVYFCSPACAEKFKAAS